MTSCYPIDQNFDQSNLSNEKSDINKKMKNRRDHSLEHLFLAKSNQQNIPQPLPRLIIQVFFLPQLHIAPYPAIHDLGNISYNHQYNMKLDLPQIHDLKRLAIQTSINHPHIRANEYESE